MRNYNFSIYTNLCIKNETLFLFTTFRATFIELVHLYQVKWKRLKKYPDFFYMKRSIENFKSYLF